MSAPPLLVLLLLLCASVQVHAQQAVILGKDLEPQSATFLGLSDEGIRVADRLGEVKTLGDDQLLRVSLIQSSHSAASEDTATARLVDGQFLVGQFLGPGDDGESLRMSSPALGKEVELPLDDLISITLPGGQAMAPNLEDDTLQLGTGETLVGFIEAVDVDAIAFVVGDADDPIDIPFDRIRGFTIANKPKPIKLKPEDRMVRVALWDGSVLVLKSAETPEDAAFPLRLTGVSVLPLPVPVVTLPISEVASLELISASRRLERLTAFGFDVVKGGKVFGVEMPPKLTLQGSLQLHAPVTLGFELPEGASRLVFRAALTLGDEISPSRRALAGCELVVYDGEQTVGRFKLEPDTAAQRINLPLTSGELRIELDPGVNGPVLDRVVLSDAEVLIESTR